MKEKRVSIQVQRVIYVAEDGMEFTSEFMCKAHEAEMERDRLEDAVSALPRFEFTPEWADSDIVWKWYFISNKEELDAVRKVVFFDRDSAAYEYERDDYPAWIAFSVDEEGSGYQAEVARLNTEKNKRRDAILDDIYRLIQKDVGHGLSQVKAQRLWAYAWEQGRANGFSEVYYYLQDLIELARMLLSKDRE